MEYLKDLVLDYFFLSAQFFEKITLYPCVRIRLTTRVLVIAIESMLDAQSTLSKLLLLLLFAMSGTKVISLCAHDTIIYYASESISEIIQEINADLEALKKRLEGKKLSLNVAKTEAMIMDSNC